MDDELVARTARILAEYTKRTGKPVTQETLDALAELNQRADELIAEIGPRRAIAEMRKLADKLERRSQ